MPTTTEDIPEITKGERAMFISPCSEISISQCSSKEQAKLEGFVAETFMAPC